MMCPIHYNCLRAHTFVVLNWFSLFVLIHDYQRPLYVQIQRIISIVLEECQENQSLLSRSKRFRDSKGGRWGGSHQNRKSWCQMKGEDVKKWREGIMVLKDNILYIYKNETVGTWLHVDFCRRRVLR